MKEAAPEVRFVELGGQFCEEIGLGCDPAPLRRGPSEPGGRRCSPLYTGRYLRSLGYEPREQTEKNQAAWQAAAEYWRGQGKK